MIKYLSKLLYILPAPKIRLILLLLLFLGTSIIEVFGIGIVGPFITLATTPEMIHKYSWLQFIFNYSGLNLESQFIALLGLLVAIIFSLKTVATWFTQVYILSFSNQQQAEVAIKLVNNYLTANYSFHIKNNSSYIINNVLESVGMLAQGVVAPLLGFISNLLISSLIFILLYTTNSSVVIVILLILLPLLFLLNSFKDKIKKWGEESRLAKQEIIRIINHGLGGIKETKIIGCESYFKEQLSQQVHRLSETNKKFFAFRLLPRYITETIMLIAIVSIVSVFLLFNQNIEQLTSILGIFILAAFRMVPLISNSINSITVLRNSSDVVNKLYFDIRALETKTAKDQLKLTSGSRSTDYAIELKEQFVLKHVFYSYPDTLANAICDISLVVKKGESVALIGKSGAGKTTLVDLILGLLTPQSGDIQVDGQSIYQNIRAWQNSIGYIPQSIFLIDDTLERNIAFGVPDHLIDQKRLDKAVESAQLTEVVNNLPNGIKTQVGERGVLLSGGQRQRVGIARALYHEREILVLDEATAALDNETEALVTNAIQSLSGTKTMIIIAHRLTTVQHCDRIYLLDQGRINKFGSYEEVVLK